MPPGHPALSTSYGRLSGIRFDGSGSALPISAAHQRPPREETCIGASGAARQCGRGRGMHVVEIFLPLTRNDGKYEQEQVVVRAPAAELLQRT